MSALELFLIQNKQLNIIFLTRFGSHLYGTSTEQSDQDFKGVFIPTIEECILGKVPKQISFKSNKPTGKEASKNSSEDTDIELYSLQYFLKLLQKGDTGALDMLHAPIGNSSIVLRKTDIWGFLHANREDFYTTNLSAFIGYCRNQAAKYGIKGSRLNDAKKVLDFLRPYRADARLSKIWDVLPEGEHIHKIGVDTSDGSPDYRFYQVCGKKIQETVTVEYARGIIDRFYEAYGKRAQLAAENKGIDWKAISHALRCAYEMEAIYRNGDITFPLPQADYLLAVKNGERDYLTDVAPKIEFLMAHVEEYAKRSSYPNKVNIKRYEEWLVKIYSLKDKESSILNPVHTSLEAIAMRNNAIGHGR